MILELGRPLLRAVRVASTMTWAREAVERGRVAAGAVLVADAQSAGRGRHGREWSSPAGKGLYLTAVLPSALASPAVTLAGALGVAEAVERACGVQASVKWPNDLLARDRKLGGLLAEVLPQAGGLVLLGVGINVTQRETDFGPELARVATSLALETGGALEREMLLTHVLAALGARLSEFANGGFPAVADAYRRRSAILPGDRLRIASDGGPSWSGTFRALDADGRLLVDESVQPLASATVLNIRRGAGA